MQRTRKFLQQIDAKELDNPVDKSDDDGEVPAAILLATY
jgi:hypothetical protein